MASQQAVQFLCNTCVVSERRGELVAGQHTWEEDTERVLIVIELEILSDQLIDHQIFVGETRCGDILN